jgi:ABC-type transport system involved in cytochrome c biogenesis permease subunit
VSPNEVSAHWSAVAGYALATLAAGAAICFVRPRLLLVANSLLGLGAAANIGALGVRWLATGHAPFLGRYEAFSSHALTVAIVFLALQSTVRLLRPGVLVAAPVAFLLLGTAVLSPASPTYPSPALSSPWLTIHVSVAKLAFSMAVVSGAAGLFSERISYRLLGYTFFLMSVVILSGAVWASAAWGSYWSWDPVETWSLLFWAGCALVLHLRASAGWTGPRWTRAVVLLTVLGVVSFIGYGHFGVSLHAAYMAP